MADPVGQEVQAASPQDNPLVQEAVVVVAVPLREDLTEFPGRRSVDQHATYAARRDILGQFVLQDGVQNARHIIIMASASLGLAPDAVNNIT